MNESTWMYIFGSAFVILVAVNAIVFSVKKGTTFRKKYLRFSGIPFLMLFGLLPLVQFWPSPISLIFVPFLVFIGFLQVKLTKYCDSCDKLRYNRQMFEPMNYCSVCGEEFEKEELPDAVSDPQNPRKSVL